jgi:ferritin-like metal-binding protein YciE
LSLSARCGFAPVNGIAVVGNVVASPRGPGPLSAHGSIRFSKASRRPARPGRARKHVRNIVARSASILRRVDGVRKFAMSGTALIRLAVDQMAVLLGAEPELAKAFGRVERRAAEPKLKKFCKEGVTTTNRRVRRLKAAFRALGLKAEPAKPAALPGLIEDARAAARGTPAERRDAAILAAIEPVSHYGLALYTAIDRNLDGAVVQAFSCIASGASFPCPKQPIPPEFALRNYATQDVNSGRDQQSRLLLRPRGPQAGLLLHERDLHARLRHRRADADAFRQGGEGAGGAWAVRAEKD